MIIVILLPTVIIDNMKPYDKYNTLGIPRDCIIRVGWRQIDISGTGVLRNGKHVHTYCRMSSLSDSLIPCRLLHDVVSLTQTDSTSEN